MSPWQYSAAAGRRFHGKDIHRLRADVKRCEEELVVLPKEMRRLGGWAVAVLRAIDDRLASLGLLEEGHSEYAIREGLTLRLTSFKSKVLRMKGEVDKMEWGAPLARLS